MTRFHAHMVTKEVKTAVGFESAGVNGAHRSTSRHFVKLGKKIKTTFPLFSSLVVQGRIRSVAEAMRMAVVSLLNDHTLNFGKSFYYWATFLPHGCAQVELDASTLSAVSTFIKGQKSSTG